MYRVFFAARVAPADSELLSWTVRMSKPYVATISSCDLGACDHASNRSCCHLVVSNHSFLADLRTQSTLKSHTITIQQQQSSYGPLSGTTRVSRYQKKHSPTHHPDHHSIFISFFHLLWSIASSLFKSHAWYLFTQPLSTSCLVYLLVWSPPPHIPYISSPSQCLVFTTHAYARNLFCCSIKIISSTQNHHSQTKTVLSDSLTNSNMLHGHYFRTNSKLWFLHTSAW